MSDEKGKRALDLFNLLKSLSISPENKEEEEVEHKFWSTQPVPKNKKELIEVEVDGPIDNLKDEKEKLRLEPYQLPEGYEFVPFNIDNCDDLTDLYELLRENYVEDYDSLFRFDYSREFLLWALKGPGWKSEWHVAIRCKNDKNLKFKLVAFICAVPCKFKIRKNSLTAVEVNFLCVEKPLRATGLAPLLIQEVTRRVNLNGIFQAIYTAGIALNEPIGTAQYYHRPLNFSKLLESNFTYLPPGKSVQQMCSYYKLPIKSALNIRPLVENDLPRVCELLEIYLKKFELSHELTLEECRHWFLLREKVVYSYVILDENSNDEIIVDFFSIYSIPSTILNQPNHPNHPKIPHESIQVAYLFYYSVSSEIRLLPLIKSVLQEATRLGFDVLNCLNLMENDDNLLNALKFGAGDGQLRFYLYNWKSKPLKPHEIGFIML